MTADQKTMESFEHDYITEPSDSNLLQEVGEYFIEVINNVSEDILSDEQISRNRSLVESLAATYHHMGVPSSRAAKNIEIFFSGINHYGFR